LCIPYSFKTINIMDLLPQIVGGLSKEEVRFFKIFAHRQDTNDLRKDIKLFDFIRKHKEEGEDKIVKQLYGTGDKNAYYRLKNRLADDINTALVLQHHTDDEGLQLLRLLQVVRIYLSKNQHNLALYFLKKAEQKAKKIEHLELLDIIYGEFIQLSHTLMIINPEEYIALRKENSEDLSRLRQMDDMLAVVSYRLKITQNFGAKENSLLDLLEQITNQFSADQATRNSSRFRFKLYSLVSQLLLQKKDYQSLETYLLQTWGDFNREKLFTRNSHDIRLQMLTYIVNTLFKNGKVQESLKYAELLRETMLQFNKQLYDKYEIFYYNALVNNYSTFDIPKAIKLLQEMQQLENVKKLPFYELFIYINLATSYFDMKNFSQAIKNLNKAYLLDSYAKADATLKFKIAVAEMIIRYELGDLDFWKYRYDQIIKEFKNELEGNNHSAERLMLSIVSSSIDLNNGLRSREIRNEIHELIQLLESQSEEDEIIKYSRWLKEKIHAV
jgi:tetratricopeptide (TPR) repeat protein